MIISAKEIHLALESGHVEMEAYEGGFKATVISWLSPTDPHDPHRSLEITFRPGAGLAVSERAHREAKARAYFYVRPVYSKEEIEEALRNFGDLTGWERA